MVTESSQWRTPSAPRGVTDEWGRLLAALREGNDLQSPEQTSDDSLKSQEKKNNVDVIIRSIRTTFDPPQGD